MAPVWLAPLPTLCTEGCSVQARSLVPWGPGSPRGGNTYSVSRQGRGVSAGLCCGGQRGAGERAGRAGDPWLLPLPVLRPLCHHWRWAPWPPRLPDGHILLPLPHGSSVCGPSPDWSMWFGRVACRRVKPCPVCLLTVSLFMGQVSCVYWGHCGQGAQEDEPEKPLEEQGRWGRGSQCVPCRLLVVPGSRGEGPPHPRAESKVCGLLVSLLFSRSVVSDAVTPRTAARPASLSITNSWSLLKLTSIESVMPSNHLILCHPLLLLP